MKNVSAKDIMTEEILSVEPTITVQEATELMDKHNIGSLVVLSPIKDLLGIFTERDLVRRVVSKKLDPAKTKIQKVMTPKVMVAQANDSALDLLEVMFREKFRHLPVVDGREVIGIISLKDFYKCLLKNNVPGSKFQVLSTMIMDKNTLEVILAHSAGTCFGVQGAIDIAEDKRKPILGPLVHNPKIVGDLASQGIPILERYTDLEKIKEKGMDEVIITAHGYPKELKTALIEKGIQFHDATCPVLLKWVYGKIETFEGEGYHVIIVGNPNHAEIIASRTYGKNTHVVYSEEEIDSLPDNLEKVVAICQTTITRDKFEALVDYMRATKYPHLKAVDTRCKPVKNQQEAVEKLAQWVDAMIIIGGFDSSNTTNLARLSQKYLPQTTYHVDSATLVQETWLENVRHLGLGAGTSTPKAQIKEVQQKILDIYPGKVLFRQESKDGEILDVDFTPEDEF